MNEFPEYPSIKELNRMKRAESERTGKPFHETIMVVGVSRIAIDSEIEVDTEDQFGTEE